MIVARINFIGRKAIADLVAQVKRPTALYKVLGRSLRNLLLAHFRERDRENPNKLAPNRRSHFWLQIARSVQQPELSLPQRTVWVDIADPRIGQKVHGGIISAKRAENLTIPVDEQAYGRTVETFEHETGLELTFVRKRNSWQGLATIVAATGELKLRYILKPSVFQKRDPEALPADPEILAEVIHAGRRHVARMAARANAAT